MNLVNNAIDAVRESDARWVRVRVDDADGAASITVEDAGPGVPKEDEVFSAFFTTKGAAEGTGLGLSISKGIVERHGGTLRYEREDGRTRFVVRLPRATRTKEERT